MNVISIKNIDTLEYEILTNYKIPNTSDSWHTVVINDSIGNIILLFRFNLNRSSSYTFQDKNSFIAFFLDVEKYPNWRLNYNLKEYYLSFSRRTGIDIKILDDFYSKYKRETSINSILL